MKEEGNTSASLPLNIDGLQLDTDTNATNATKSYAKVCATHRHDSKQRKDGLGTISTFTGVDTDTALNLKGTAGNSLIRKARWGVMRDDTYSK